MLCAISLDRFVAIVLATKYQKLLTKKRGLIIIFLIWMLSSLLSLPPLIGWSTYKYNPGTLHCSPLWVGQCAYFYFAFTISVIIPSTITVLSYTVIFWKVRKHRKRVSMWKRRSEKVVSSMGNDGLDSAMEMSQIATIHKSPMANRPDKPDGKKGMAASHGEVNANDPVTSSKSLSPLPETNTQRSESVVSAAIADDNISQRETDNADTKDEEHTRKVHANTVTSINVDIQNNGIIFESRDIFYDPKRTGSSQSARSGQPLIVKERAESITSTANVEMLSVANSSDVERNEEKPRSENHASYQMVKENCFKAPTEVNIVSKMCNRITVDVNKGTKAFALSEPTITEDFEKKTFQSVSKSGERTAAKIGVTKTSEKKTSKNSLGRLKKHSRKEKEFNHSRLSEEDANGLLNVSEGGGIRKDSSSTTSNREEVFTKVPPKTNLNTTVSNTRQTKRRKLTASTSSAVGSSISKTASQIQKKFKRRSRRTSKATRASKTLREIQVAKTGAILLTVFMICYGPYTVVHLCHVPFNVPFWAQHIAMWCVFLNSIMTPVVYGLMNKETRTKVKALLRRCWK